MTIYLVRPALNSQASFSVRHIQVTALLDGIPVPYGALLPQISAPLDDGEDSQVVCDARKRAHDERVLIS